MEEGDWVRMRDEDIKYSLFSIQFSSIIVGRFWFPEYGFAVK